MKTSMRDMDAQGLPTSEQEQDGLSDPRVHESTVPAPISISALLICSRFD